MKRLKTVHYTIHSEKIKDIRGARFAVIADLHGMQFGPENRRLLEIIDKYRPDGILIAGDMIVRCAPASLKTTAVLLKKLALQYPVYYELGNHEYKLYRSNPEENAMAEDYLEYERELKMAGIHILHNESCKLQTGKNDIIVHGLEIPLVYYKKPFSPTLHTEEIRELIGEPEKDSLNILLAHNPKYGNAYFDWGADVILSGHYHGGVIRLGRRRGLLSPQLQLFPAFCCGDFHREGRHMLVSAGTGEHTVPVRLHNPRELLIVDIRPRMTEE